MKKQKHEQKPYCRFLILAPTCFQAFYIHPICLVRDFEDVDSRCWENLRTWLLLSAHHHHQYVYAHHPIGAVHRYFLFAPQPERALTVHMHI